MWMRQCEPRLTSGTPAKLSLKLWHNYESMIKLRHFKLLNNRVLCAGFSCDLMNKCAKEVCARFSYEFKSFKSRELHSLLPPSRLLHRFWLASTYRIRLANFRNQYVYLITFSLRAARESKRKSISYLSSGMKCMKNLWQTRNRSREPKTPTNRVETYTHTHTHPAVHIQAKNWLEIDSFLINWKILSTIWRARLLFWPQLEWTNELFRWKYKSHSKRTREIGSNWIFMPKTHCQSPSCTALEPSHAQHSTAQIYKFGKQQRFFFCFGRNVKERKNVARFFRFHSSPHWNCNPWYGITACHGNKTWKRLNIAVNVDTARS